MDPDDALPDTAELVRSGEEKLRRSRILIDEIDRSLARGAALLADGAPDAAADAG